MATLVPQPDAPFGPSQLRNTLQLRPAFAPNRFHGTVMSTPTQRRCCRLRANSCPPNRHCVRPRAGAKNMFHRKPLPFCSSVSRPNGTCVPQPLTAGDTRSEWPSVNGTGQPLFAKAVSALRSSLAGNLHYGALLSTLRCKM